LEQVSESRIALNTERINQLRRREQAEAADLAKRQAPHPTDDFTSTFYGGTQGEMGKFAMKIGKSYGLISNTEGVSTISIEGLEQAGELLMGKGSPHSAGFLRAGLNEANKNITTIETELKEKDNPKLQEQLKIHKAARAEFIGRLDGLHKVTEAEAKHQSEKEKFSFEKKKEKTRAQEKQEEFELKDRALDIAASKKAAGSTARKKTQAQEKEADMIKIARQVEDELASGAKTPDDIYAEGYRMNDDGTLFTKRAVDDDGNIVGKAVELPKWTDGTGKRGGVTALKAAGEYRDDAMQLKALLDDPEVAKNLRIHKPEEDSDLWDRTKGTVENRVRAWATKVGISEDSPTVTALRRIQRMASEERKKFLGSAVTGTELKTTLGWMLNPGDSYDAMMNKINLVESEADETFRRHLGVYRHIANMSEWYDAYGISRFGGTEESDPSKMSDAQILEALRK
jgi:hypothetical protein